MIPAKEKARELVDKMHNIPDGGFGSIGVYEAKQCALIAVDEIINYQFEKTYGYLDLYWQEVKQEIEKL